MDYFELYYAYLSQCEKENWASMRDPNHDYMEWNHTLPQCIFGDQPIGQWLTIEQHAIASALQTLAFNRSCLCGWHKKYLPLKLWKLVKPIYSHLAAESMRKMSSKNREKRYVNALKALRKEIKVFCPNGDQIIFNSVGDVALHFKVSGSSITKYLKHGRILGRGKAKGYVFFYEDNVK